MDNNHHVVAIAIILLLSATLSLVSTACPASCQCRWNQVECSEWTLSAVPSADDIAAASEVASLELHHNHIASLANVFHDFTSLKVLDLSYNRIQEIDTEDLQNNTHLQQLYLQSNVIRQVQPGSFGTLANLTLLNLGNNSISKLNSSTLRGLESLQHLDLHDNGLSNISGSPLDEVPSLESLDLSFNEIRDIHNLFENSVYLQAVNLSNNKIMVIDGSDFHGNNSISHLNLSHNEIQSISNLSSLSNLLVLEWGGGNGRSVSASTFEGLANLTDLVLDGNWVEYINTSVFQCLDNLQMLSLSMMPNMKYLSPQTFEGLPGLSRLYLHHNSLLSFIHRDLFVPLKSISIIDISFNQIVYLLSAIGNNTQLMSLDVRGNKLSCDCSIEWLLNSTISNDSVIKHNDELLCFDPVANTTVKLLDIVIEDLHCSEINITHHSADGKHKIGHSAVLQCTVVGSPTPEITWITPRGRVLHYHNFHEYSRLEYLPVNDSTAQAQFHRSHDWHQQQSYYSESEDRADRLVVLEDGSLFIDYVLRSDGGPYKCIAKNSRNKTEIVINFYIDYSILGEVKIWSLVVGGACAGGFFLLNLTYSLTLAAVRRCISQRRRERIRHIIETMDQYKTHQLSRIKENYNHQVGRIRDQYHYQLGRLREHHQNQAGRMGRMREGASQRVEKLRDNYNNQLGRLKGYSSSQLLQIREKYNNQIDKIKDYGNDKLDRIHEKYKLKQQHVIKLLEMMNMENCRTVFESECVRTESMILESGIFNADVTIPVVLDSDSVSDSEYLTATSSESSKYTSRENLNANTEDATGDTIPSVSKLVPYDDCETYHLVNEEFQPNDTLLSGQAAASVNTSSCGLAEGIEGANISSRKRLSVKSRRQEGSRKRRSKSDMVLTLPHGDDAFEDLLPIGGRKLSRRYPSASSRSHVSGSNLSEEMPSTSGLNDSVDDLDDILVLPGETIRESTV